MIDSYLIHISHDRMTGKLGEYPIDVIIIAFEALFDIRADDFLSVMFMDVVERPCTFI